MDTRTANMEKRRARILTEAHRAIAEGGFRALTLRSLAKAAGVTQPTVYNLVGNKEAILRRLLEASVARVEERLALFRDEDPLAMLEAVANESAALFSEDESFYRSALVASEHLEDQEQVWGRNAGTVRRSVALPAEACRAARRAGLLRGSIPIDRIAEQMFAAYRSALRDWAFRLISLEEFRSTALEGFYLCMAADAEDGFRELLIRKIRGVRRQSSRRIA